MTITLEGAYSGAVLDVGKSSIAWPSYGYPDTVLTSLVGSTVKLYIPKLEPVGITFDPRVSKDYSFGSGGNHYRIHVDGSSSSSKISMTYIPAPAPALA
jgi:hypothetical protein